MAEHEHDLVRVEDAQHGVAWSTCRSCAFRTESEPWSPDSQEDED